MLTCYFRLFGISNLQIMTYFLKYKDDPRWLKILVSLNTVPVCLISRDFGVCIIGIRCIVSQRVNGLAAFLTDS